MNKLNKQQDGFHVVEALIIISVVALIVFAGWFVYQRSQRNTETSTSTATTPTQNESTKTWQGGDYAIKGDYADADIVKLDNGTYRMYYATQPEVAGNQLEVYSATSKDGKTWKQESGERKTMATFPDVVKLEDGTWRMYFQNAGAIKSATSKDGLIWTDESGDRITTSGHEVELDNVAASTTFLRDDGTYVMVYRGQIDKQYKAGVPNQQTGLLFWATSKDGLKFEKQGIALDSRNDTYEGWMDGPDLVKWDDGKVKVFFWSYQGVYESEFDGKAFKSATLAYDAAKASGNPNNKYPSDIPGDPTLMQIGSTWFMYYGSTGDKSGIHYFTLQ